MKFTEFISKKIYDDVDIYANSNLSGFILDMYIGEDCNLSCRHCYFGNHTKSKDELTDREWIKIIDDFLSVGCRHFHISGRESLLSDKTKTILNYLNNIKNTYGIFYGIITNGTSLSTVEYQNLIDTNIDYIEFSIDGLAENHNMMRGEGVYEKVISTISNLDSKNKISIAYSLYKDNLCDFRDTVIELSEIGIKYYFCTTTHNRGYAKINKLEPVSHVDFIKLIDNCKYLLSNEELHDIDIKFRISPDCIQYLLDNNIYNDEITLYLLENKKIMWGKRTNIVELSLQMFEIPYYLHASISASGYILRDTNDIDIKNIQKVRYTNIENFMAIRKDSVKINLKRKN